MTRTALYHGVGPIPIGGDPVYQVPSRGFAPDISEADFKAILLAASAWLDNPLLSGSPASSDISYRAALDLAIQESPFQGQVNARNYNWLLSRLQGRADAAYSGEPVVDPRTPNLAARGNAPEALLQRAAKAHQSGDSVMNRTASKQVDSILGGIDKMASYLEKNAPQLGFDRKTAAAIITALDKASDTIEISTCGRDSLRNRASELRQAAVIERDADEPYMDTFRNPQAPIQVESDEPYMSSYADDQSSGVGNGESSTGRPLAPKY